MKRDIVVVLMTCLSPLALLGSIDGSAGASQAMYGTVSGTFRMVGGPYPGLNELVPGIVTMSPAKNNRQHAVRIVVTTSGRFSTRVGVGTWSVSGRTPKDDHSETPCGGTRITVTNHQTVRVSVQCDVP
jgi:hypothetical protein